MEDTLIDELKKWLEFTPSKDSELDNLKQQLAMEEDPSRRKELQRKIDKLEIPEEERATLPTRVLGPL